MSYAVNTTEVISVNIKDQYGDEWKGPFRIKVRLTARDLIEVDRTRRELLGGVGGTPDESVDAMIRVLSQLKVRVAESPSWWQDLSNGLDSIDWNISVEIFSAAVKAERAYLDTLRKKVETDVQALKDAAVK